MIRFSAAVVALCVAILLGDYVVATVRAPQDDRTIKAMEKQVKENAAVAPKLEAEEKRVTDARLSRQKRDRFTGWVLLVAAAAFVTCVKMRPAVTKVVAVAPVVSDEEEVVARRPAKAVVPPEIDLKFVDEMVTLHGRTKEASIPLLQAVQTHYRYLPDEALRRICELTEITPAQIAGTSTFYGQFRRSPVGEHIVRVCHGTACHVSGARQVTDELRRHLGMEEGEDTDPDRQFTIEEVACLGCCSLAPVLMVDGQAAGKLTPASACKALAPYAKEPA